MYYDVHGQMLHFQNQLDVHRCTLLVGFHDSEMSTNQENVVSSFFLRAFSEGYLFVIVAGRVFRVNE